ncbi:hypothetical protein D3C83_182070 [compost metagenome]
MAGGVQDLGVQPRYFHKELSRRLVPVEREEAIKLFHSRRPLLNRLERSALRPRALRQYFGRTPQQNNGDH